MGDPHVLPQAEARFPALTLVTGQALRINAVNIGDPHVTPCPVDLDIRNAAARRSLSIGAALAAGDSDVARRLREQPQGASSTARGGGAAKDRMVKESCGTFLFSVEIYDLVDREDDVNRERP